MGKNPIVTCDDCFFSKAGLCALRTGVVCPTFRAAAARTGALVPPRQPTLVLRPIGFGTHAPAAA